MRKDRSAELKPVRGRRGFILRRLVSLASDVPPPEVYRPPADVYEGNDRIHLTGVMNANSFLAVRYKVHRGMIVDFSLNQVFLDDMGVSSDVSRVDTKHGTVHRHQFFRSSGVPAKRWEICPIPAGDESSWEIVNKAYDEQLTVMHDDWVDNLRRWSGD